MKYEDVPLDKPFYILRPNGDSTVWRKDDSGLVIYFHVEKFWCNPPTDTNMEWRAVKAIEKYGIKYLPDGYAEKFKSLPFGEDMKYAKSVADEVLGVLVTKRVKKQ